MKIFKDILVLILISLISSFILYYLKSNNTFIIIFIFLTIGFFIFNFTIRKSLKFKSYFTSKYNLFTTKFRYKKSYDISRDLMFEKVIEVVNNSNFKLVETDNEKPEILAITTITFRSWGENLYIGFETIGNETIMNFCSTTLFQLYSWGKNEKNYNNLINEIDKSLII